MCQQYGNELEQLRTDRAVHGKAIELLEQLRVLDDLGTVQPVALAQYPLGRLAAALHDHLRKFLACLVGEADDFLWRSPVVHTSRFSESRLTTCSMTERTTALCGFSVR